MDNNNLGVILKNRRKEKGLRLVDVSKLSGVSMAHIARVERGERFPSLRILRKLAKPLDFTEVEILKLAGFISRDSTDNRIEKVKAEIKLIVSQALIEAKKQERERIINYLREHYGNVGTNASRKTAYRIAKDLAIGLTFEPISKQALTEIQEKVDRL